MNYQIKLKTVHSVQNCNSHAAQQMRKRSAYINPLKSQMDNDGRCDGTGQLQIITDKSTNIRDEMMPEFTSSVKGKQTCEPDYSTIIAT